MRIAVKVIPNSNRTEISKEDDILKVRIKTPPNKGKANNELIGVLAKHFNTSKSKVRILKGDKSRDKLIEIFD